MAYDIPERLVYSFSDQTFGATSVVHNVIGPKGKVGFVRDIEVDIQTSIVGTTTVPEIDVGISSGDFTYGRYRLGTAAGTPNAVGVRRASGETDVVGNPPRTGSLFSGHVVLDGGPLGTSGSIAGGSSTTVNPAGRIPANTAFTITCAAGTGGSPAGGGTVRVTIEWIGQNIGG